MVRAQVGKDIPDLEHFRVEFVRVEDAVSGSRESRCFRGSVVDVCSLGTKLIPARGVVLGDWLLGHYRVDVLSNMESGNDWCRSGGLTSTVAMELGLFQTTQLHTGLHTCDLGTGLLSPHGMSGRGVRCRGGEGRSAPPACPPAAAPHGPHLSYGDCLSAETNVHGHQGHIFQGGVTEF